MMPFQRPRPVDRPDVRLIAFHHAGGSANPYHPLSRSLPDCWDLLLFDLPGHGRRHAQIPDRSMGDLVARTMSDLAGWLDEPIALFGHSLGAILAFELAQCCEIMEKPLLWLGVSGRAGPGTLLQPRQCLHELDDATLLKTLLGLGGTSDKIAEEPEFLTLFLRNARADLEAVDTYVPDPSRPRLTVPISAFAGTTDGWAPPSSMRCWAEETEAEFQLHQFGGGHFYFLGKTFPILTQMIVNDITYHLPHH